MKKRVLSLILCAMMLTSLFPVSIYAEAEPEAAEPVAEETVTAVGETTEAAAPEEGNFGEEETEQEPAEAQEPAETQEPDPEAELVEEPEESIAPASEDPAEPDGSPDAGLTEDAELVEGEGVTLAADPDGAAENSPAPDAESGTNQTEEPEKEDLFIELAPVSTQEGGFSVEDNEELLKGYAQKRLNNAKGMLRASSTAGRRLAAENPQQGAIYSYLKPQIISIADGNLSSSVFTGTGDDLMAAGIISQTWYTASELGLSDIFSDTDRAQTELMRVTGLNAGLSPAMKALLSDCAYELYWYDKASGIGYTYQCSAQRKSGVESIGIVSFTYEMTVAAEYRANGDAYTVSGDHASTISTAISTAQGIVADAASYGDEDKLDYYRQQICNLTSYNQSAAANSSTPYGNPWQLIWVFDGDASTTVVCEGYSKAFQYLCELSQFSGQVDCYSVSGTMGGPHMWNIVCMDGKNYHVDVTNCDSNSIGYPDLLFMTGYDSGSVSDGYTFNCNGSSCSYAYDDDTVQTFGTAALTLVKKETPSDISIEVESATTTNCRQVPFQLRVTTTQDVANDGFACGVILSNNPSFSSGEGNWAIGSTDVLINNVYNNQAVTYTWDYGKLVPGVTYYAKGLMQTWDSSGTTTDICYGTQVYEFTMPLGNTGYDEIELYGSQWVDEYSRLFACFTATANSLYVLEGGDSFYDMDIFLSDGQQKVGEYHPGESYSILFYAPAGETVYFYGSTSSPGAGVQVYEADFIMDSVELDVSTDAANGQYLMFRAISDGWYSVNLNPSGPGNLSLLNTTTGSWDNCNSILKYLASGECIYFYASYPGEDTKTVLIQSAEPPTETMDTQALIAALDTLGQEAGTQSLTLANDLVLSENVTIPENVELSVAGTLTVTDGVLLSIRGKLVLPVGGSLTVTESGNVYLYDSAGANWVKGFAEIVLDGGTLNLADPNSLSADGWSIINMKKASYGDADAVLAMTSELNCSVIVETAVYSDTELANVLAVADTNPQFYNIHVPNGVQLNYSSVGNQVMFTVEAGGTLVVSEGADAYASDICMEGGSLIVNGDLVLEGLHFWQEASTVINNAYLSVGMTTAYDHDDAAIYVTIQNPGTFCAITSAGNAGYISETVSFDGNQPETENQEQMIRVTVSSSDEDGNSVALLTGGGYYTSGDNIVVSASPVNGYEFRGWYRGGSIVCGFETYTFVAEEDVSLVAMYRASGTVRLTVTGAENVVEVNGQLQTESEVTYQFPSGTWVTLEYAGEGNFIRWCNESRMTEGTGIELSFQLLRDMSVTAVRVNIGEGGADTGYEGYVEFVSYYGQVLEGAIWNSQDDPYEMRGPKPPFRLGKEWTGWSIDGVTPVIPPEILALIGTGTRHVRLVPLYRDVYEPCTVNVYFDGVLQLYYAEKSSSISISARNIPGKTFLQWRNENGTVLGTGETLHMFADNVDVYADYVDAGEAAERYPVLNLLDVLTDRGETRLSFLLSRDLPEGYTLKRLVLMVSENPVYGIPGAEDYMLIDRGIPQAVSASTSPHGTLMVNKTMADRYQLAYARGYMLVEDPQGNLVEYYTPIVSAYVDQNYAT